MVVPQNGLFIMEYPNKMDDFGGTPHFRKPPYIYIAVQCATVQSSSQN